jgi:hypothetical protein
MHSLTSSPAPLHFVLPPTPVYPFFPSSPTPCRPFSTAKPRRRALRVYFVPFSDLFFAKSKISSRKSKMSPYKQTGRLATTAQPRRRALRVYLVSFSDLFFAKNKISSRKSKYLATNQKWTPTHKHVDLPIQPNPGLEPAVYALYPFQTFFSQKTQYLATNPKCTPAKTGWVR